MKARVVLLVAAAVAACTDARLPQRPVASDPRPVPARARLTDLSGSLDALRADFNAHKGERRFLTLLAPT